MREERRAYNIYRRALFGGWLVLCGAAYLSGHTSGQNWGHTIFLFLLAVVCEAVPIHLAELGEISLTFLIVWAAMLLCPPLHVTILPLAVVFFVYSTKWSFARAHQAYAANPVAGPAWASGIRAVLLGSVSRVLAFDWVDRHNYPLRHLVSLMQLNGSSMAICAGAAALVYRTAGGLPMTTGSPDISIQHTLFPMVLAVAVYFILDIATFSATCVIWENRPDYTHSWRSWVLRSTRLLTG